MSLENKIWDSVGVSVEDVNDLNDIHNNKLKDYEFKK